MSRPLRIFVASAADLLTDHRAHGEGLIAWNLFSSLAARGHELVVCARTVDLHVEPPFQVVETGRASRWESLEPFGYARRMTRLFGRLDGTGRFDAMHWLFPQGGPLAIPTRSLPFVIGPWSLSWRDPDGRGRRRRLGDLVRHLLGPVEQSMRRRALERTTAILASTPEAVDDLPERFRPKASVLPFAVDLSRFVASPVPSSPTVVFLGSLEQKKGVRELVDAFGPIAAAIPEARLVLGGDGPERTWIESRISELGLAGRVELRGRLRHVDIPEFLAGASLVCLPSHGEPFGMALLEAMAVGRAAVAVDEAGPRFLIDPVRGGRLVRRHDPDALAEAMIELLRDPVMLGRLGRFNRDRVEAEFSIDVVLDRLERLYRVQPAAAPLSALTETVG
jgi:glycosyltransferase involved in cell wall biosynthesis